jgi:hypothetical protein
MEWQVITPELVHRAEQMLWVDIEAPIVASQLGVSEYVVGVIAGDDRRPGPPPAPRPVSRRVTRACRSVDAGTIRLIRRMLDARSLNYVEIAREAGVSESTVSAVARGVRHLGTGLRPRLDAHEQYLPEGTRCTRCGLSVVVLPCRACAAEDYSASPSQTSWSDGTRCPSRSLRKESVMSNLLTVLSAEVAAVLSATDKREYVITRAEKLFDDTIAKVDLPGPDQIIDPIIRSTIRPVVGKLFDEIVKELEGLSHA